MSDDDLHMAALANDVGRVAELIAGGADPELVNRHGQTPRGLAELIGNYDVAQFFPRD